MSGVMQPGEIRWRDDDFGSGANYWGSNILWNGGQEGWVVILDPQNTVIDVMAKGYLLNGRLVRAARVIVSKNAG